MRGGRKQAKLACGRPFDGRVRPRSDEQRLRPTSHTRPAKHLGTEAADYSRHRDRRVTCPGVLRYGAHGASASSGCPIYVTPSWPGWTAGQVHCHSRLRRCRRSFEARCWCSPPCILLGKAFQRRRRNVAEHAKRFAGRQRTGSPARPLRAPVTSKGDGSQAASGRTAQRGGGAVTWACGWHYCARSRTDLAAGTAAVPMNRIYVRYKKAGSCGA